MAKFLDDSFSPGDVFGNGMVTVNETGDDGVPTKVTIDGRRYILEELPPDVASLPDPDIMRKILPPPRRVSPLLFASMFSTDWTALMFGWFWTCFGMIFVCAFLGQVHLADMSPFAGWRDAGTAKLVASEDAKFTVNDNSVYKHTFEVPLKNGGNITATSHSFQQLKKEDALPKDVQIEYSLTHRKYRIKGTTIGPMGSGLMAILPIFVIIFPIIGLCVIGFHLRKCLRYWRLLKFGEVTKGVIVDMSPTGTTVNGQPVMAVTFDYLDSRGEKHQGSIRQLDTSRLEDSECEVLFYDPEHPENVLALDTLPKSVSPDEATGAFAFHSLPTTIYTCFMTLVVLAFLGIFLAEVAYFCGFWSFTG